MKNEFLYDKSDIYYLNVIESLRQKSELQQTVISLLAGDLRESLASSLMSVKNIPGSLLSKILSNSMGAVIELMDILLMWIEVNNESREIVNERISLRSMMDKICGWFNPVMREKYTSIVNNIEPAFTAYSDQRIIEVLFKNLIQAMIKSAPDNGLITLTAEMGDYCVIVHLTSRGSEINFPSLEPEGEMGSDLGLALCVAMLEELDGFIRVNKTDMRDTRLSVYLPSG